MWRTIAVACVVLNLIISPVAWAEDDDDVGTTGGGINDAAEAAVDGVSKTGRVGKIIEKSVDDSVQENRRNGWGNSGGSGSGSGSASASDDDE